MAKVRITVLKTDYDDALSKEYGDNVNGSCSLLKPGQVIECERHYQPEGFGGEAWKCIQHYVYALYHGATEPFGKGWMKNGNVAIATYNDGLRPVTFKIELVED